MIVDEWAEFAERFEDYVLGPFEIVRVNTLEERLERAAKLSGFETVDPVKLVGPRHDIGPDVSFKAADVSKALRLLQALQYGPEVAFDS